MVSKETYYKLFDILAQDSRLEDWTASYSLISVNDEFIALRFEKPSHTLLINDTGFIAGKAMAYIPVGSDVMYPIIAQWFEDRYKHKVKSFESW